MSLGVCHPIADDDIYKQRGDRPWGVGKSLISALAMLVVGACRASK